MFGLIFVVLLLSVYLLIKEELCYIYIIFWKNNWVFFKLRRDIFCYVVYVKELGVMREFGVSLLVDCFCYLKIFVGFLFFKDEKCMLKVWKGIL